MILPKHTYSFILKHIIVPGIAWLPVASVASTPVIQPKIQNPAGFGTVRELIQAALGVVVTIAIPIIVMFIIYAGFLYVTARGNQEQLRKATRAITYAIIGALLVLGAEAFSGVIERLIASF